MEFEQFKEFMLQSGAQHDARIAAIEESLKRMANTAAILVDNQVHLQANVDQLTLTVDRLATKVDRLHDIVFRHVSDPGGHNPPIN